MGYLKHAARIFFGKVRTPPYFLFFVTRKCGAKCKHCFFWKEAPHGARELGLEEISKISSSMDDILQLTLTGGDAALRKDLPEIVKIFHTNNHTTNITTATNGSLPAVVLAQTKKALEECKGLGLTVDLSIDGIGKDHDEIRNLPGLFDKVTETAALLMDLSKTYPALNVCVDITVSHFNEEKAPEVYKYVRDKVKPHTIDLILVRGNPRDPDAKNYDVGNFEKVNNMLRRDVERGLVRGYNFFTDTLKAKDVLLRNIIIKTVKENRYQMPCTAGTLTGVLYPEGNVAPCELVDDRFGNVREYNYDMKAIWQSRAAKEYIEKIKRVKCYCIHQCFISNNILFQPKNYPSLLAEILRIKFGKMRWRRAHQLKS